MSADFDPDEIDAILEETARVARANRPPSRTELRRTANRRRAAVREFKRQLREAKRNVPIELRAKVNWNAVGRVDGADDA